MLIIVEGSLFVSKELMRVSVGPGLGLDVRIYFLGNSLLLKTNNPYFCNISLCNEIYFSN